MKKTKLETARKLAKAHRRVDSDLKRVYLLEPLKAEDQREPIKLLEIVEGTLEVGVKPISFAPDPDRGIEYPCVIVEISPKEYKDKRRLETDLGTHGWRLGTELVG